VIPTIKKILYATDLSQNSPFAFWYALDMARSKKAQVVGLHVIKTIPSFAIGLQVGTVSPEERLKKKAMEESEKRVRLLCQEMDAEIDGLCVSLMSKILVRIGDPIEEILSVADEEECDVIVLGAHGKGLLKQTFLGSVSNGVLQQSRKPVFLIPIPSDISAWDFKDFSG
jgi:nucleotide-binding universal stress UspA family protein